MTEEDRDAYTNIEQYWWECGYKWKPYYMVYPMPLMYDDEKKNRRDYEYMKSLYPKTAKRLLPYVEEECDRLEYTASMMYDECPDLLQLRLLCRRIGKRVQEEEELDEIWEEEQLEDLIQVMTYQELCRRRQEERARRKKYF